MKVNKTDWASSWYRVTTTFREIFDQRTETADAEVRLSGYEGIRIDAHYPVYDIPNLPIKPLNRTLSNAIVQGSFYSDRRDYVNIFTELIASLHGARYLSTLRRPEPLTAMSRGSRCMGLPPTR